MRRAVLCGTIYLAILIGLGGTPERAAAVMVNLSPSKDNTLYEDLQGDVSNGAGAHLFVGSVGPTGQGGIRRGLIAFDIAGNIPPGSIITRVTLKLRMTKTNNAGPQTITLHKLLANWGEGTSNAPEEEGTGAAATTNDATWVHRFFPASPWGTSGGDFSATESASKAVGDLGVYTWGSTARMVADVRAWLDQPATNFGWLLRGNEASNGTAKRFDTKESSVNQRPVLTVEFTPTCDGKVATIVGTEDNDMLIGTEEDDVIVGLDGNDIIHGLGGNDVICGGAGDDILFGDAGDDRLFGENGNDVLHGGPGNDRLVGGNGHDVLLGEDGDDLLIGGAGDDSLHGGAGNDRLLGGGGNDTIRGDAGDDVLNGGAGSDVCDGGSGDTDTDAGGCEVSINIP